MLDADDAGSDEVLASDDSDDTAASLDTGAAGRSVTVGVGADFFEETLEEAVTDEETDDDTSLELEDDSTGSFSMSIAVVTF